MSKGSQRGVRVREPVCGRRLRARPWDSKASSRWSNLLLVFLAKCVSRGRQSKPLYKGQINILKTHECEAN